MKRDSIFKDKVIWITGASSGIGEALCHEFSKLGSFLILSSRNEPKLNLVRDQLPLNAEKAKILVLDLEDLDNLTDKTSMALKLYGRIDYFISNAGLAIRDLLNGEFFVFCKG